MGLFDFRPLVQVSIGATPLGSLGFSALTSVRVSDTAGFVSDTCELVFANAGLLSQFAAPDPGAEISVALGYLGSFKPMGVYVASEVSESSPPRQIRVVARAKVEGQSDDGLKPLNDQKTRSWEDGLSLSDIVGKMASESGLDPAITEAAASIVPGHLDQLAESDMSVLTRLAVRHDLVAKPAGRKLFVGKRGGGVNASGQPMPTVLLTQTEVSRWDCRETMGDAVGKVQAIYRDLDAGQDQTVEVGTEDPVRTLRQRFRSEEEARTAAQAESQRASRAKRTLDLELPGNPNLAAEGRVVLAGFSAKADGAWLITDVVHELSQDGYRSVVKAELPE